MTIPNSFARQYPELPVPEPAFQTPISSLSQSAPVGRARIASLPGLLSSKCQVSLITRINFGSNRLSRENRISQRIEQVRKRGLPPLWQRRGQATLPDLFYLIFYLAGVFYSTFGTRKWPSAGAIFWPREPKISSGREVLVLSPSGVRPPMAGSMFVVSSSLSCST